MKAIITLFIGLAISLTLSGQTCLDHGEQIQFQEMRSDTAIVAGSYPGVVYGNVQFYRWVLTEADRDTLIDVYGGDQPYFASPLRPGAYRLIRYTDHYQDGRYTQTTRSNSIRLHYSVPEAYEDKGDR